MTTDARIARETYVLRELELFNWGAFSGRHLIEFDAGGTAIIGNTGSGKTTLVDALMTLLVAFPRYNLASTGGHESDRDLISYIRGVSGQGTGQPGDTRHIARTGKTSTGICARMVSDDATVMLMSLFWLDTASSASNDRKDLWIVSRDDQLSLETLLSLLHEEGARELRRYVRGLDYVSAFEAKRSYLAHVRRHFDVSENAFNLLNRAAGLKQILSIDEIFRELVLDDRSQFDRAEEIVREFENLKVIREELERARNQRESLSPLVALDGKHRKLVEELNRALTVIRVLPRWFASVGVDLYGERIATIEAELEQLDMDIRRATEEEATLEQEVTATMERYLQQGGGQVDQLQDQIRLQARSLARCEENAGEYQRIAKQLGLDASLQQTAFETSRAKAGEFAGDLEAERERLEDLYIGAAAEEKRCRERSEDLARALQEAKARPSSNIPAPFQVFRAEMASVLDTAEDLLPFVGELVEVKSEESAWRGAIERAIGAHRLRIVTPAELTRSALKWVNSRNNRLHVRLLDAGRYDSLRHFHDDGFTRKLNFRHHPLREPMKAFLATIDRRCVPDSAVLAHTPHALTKEGMMSGAAGQFDKPDNQSLGEGWMTGFDNRDILASLSRELETASAERERAAEALGDARKRHDVAKARLALVSALDRIHFEDINVPGAEQTLRRLESKLAALIDPDTDIGRARKTYEDVRAKWQEKQRENRERFEQRARLVERADAARKQMTVFEHAREPMLTEAEMAAADATMPVSTSLSIENLETKQREAQALVEAGRAKLDAEVQQVRERLVRQMGLAKSADSGELAEVGSELTDIPAYLSRLKVLEEESLPEKRSRFLSYLNESSDQSVTQLLARIEQEVAMIEERIEALNATLRRVDFLPGHYIQLVPSKVTHERIRALDRAQRRLRSAELTEDEGESQFRTLAELVEFFREASDNRRTLASRALMDPRYRIQFSYTVCNRDSGAILSSGTGSQGGSGGEKEIIASYILTASLSYALCPDGSSCPLFGTIVLDEAFSKSSQSVASRIISALKEFGLHAVFVTPNKEMRLLREHTNSAVIVHRKGLSATLTTVTWEQLDARRLARGESDRNEVA